MENQSAFEDLISSLSRETAKLAESEVQVLLDNRDKISQIELSKSNEANHEKLIYDLENENMRLRQDLANSNNIKEEWNEVPSFPFILPDKPDSLKIKSCISSFLHDQSMCMFQVMNKPIEL